MKVWTLFLMLAACGKPVTKQDIAERLPMVTDALITVLGPKVFVTGGYRVEFEMEHTREYDARAVMGAEYAVIKVADVIGEWSNLDELLMHELGHVLGLEHSDSPDNVMRGTQDGNTIPLDVAAKQIAQACKPVRCRSRLTVMVPKDAGGD